MHEGHTHHTVSHSHGSEPTIHNHESHEEALDHAKGEMHMGCAQCEGHGTDANAGEERQGESDDEGDDSY
jgi:hypothetical protein